MHGKESVLVVWLFGTTTSGMEIGGGEALYPSTIKSLLFLTMRDLEFKNLPFSCPCMDVCKSHTWSEY